MASMRKEAAESYSGKLDRMGLGIQTATTGPKGTGHQRSAPDGKNYPAEGSRAEGYASAEENERTMEAKAPKKLRLDRPNFKDGGRVKKGTTVNVIVAPQGGAPAGPPAMPPMPPGPPPAMPKPPIAGPAGPGGPMPPELAGMGAPPMRANGGRVPKFDAGAGSGKGRMEKVAKYGNAFKAGA